MGTSSIIFVEINKEVKIGQYFEFDSYMNEDIIIDFFSKHNPKKIKERFSKVREATGDDYIQMINSLHLTSFDMGPKRFMNKIEYDKFTKKYPQFGSDRNLIDSNFLESIVTGDDFSLLMPKMTSLDTQSVEYVFKINLDTWTMEVDTPDEKKHVILPDNNLKLSFIETYSKVLEETRISAKGDFIADMYNKINERTLFEHYRMIKWWGNEEENSNWFKKKSKAKKYLGYCLVTPEMGSEGWGGFYDIVICEGNTPEEVVKDYFKKLGNDDYQISNFHVQEDGSFYYLDYFVTYFLELPSEDVYLPEQITMNYRRKEDE